MKSKIVDNWLTNVTELTFTVPFCQLLLSKGQKVVHISSQGPMEQGKDVIAVDQAGRVHCYQLKCGKINSRVWGEIKAEIDQLVELPPRHPSLPDNVAEWEAYLVTNGGIANPTARDIDDYAAAKHEAGHRAVKTIVGPELVADFTAFYDEFIPVDVADLQEFLELYNQNGDYELHLATFKAFFERFFLSHRTASRQKKIEAIRGSLVLCNYILTRKHQSENRLEVVKAYTLLLASIYEFAESENLRDSLWADTEQLAYEAVGREFEMLIDELKDRESLLQVEYGVLAESLTYKIRCGELLGYLSAYRNYCTSRDLVPQAQADLDAILARLHGEERLLIGEIAVPWFFNRAAELRNAARDDEAKLELVRLLVAILRCHGPDDSLGLLSPYYGIAESVEWSIGIDDNIRESFRWRSYSVRSLILVLARYGLRDELNALWRILSRVAQQEVVPTHAKDYLLWRIEDGEQVDQFPDPQQSGRRSWPLRRRIRSLHYLRCSVTDYISCRF